MCNLNRPEDMKDLAVKHTVEMYESWHEYPNMISQLMIDINNFGEE